MPILEILRRHEISTTILYRAVKNADRTLRRADRADRDAAVIADYRAGMPVLEILRQHEISTTVLYRAVKNAGGALRRADRANARAEEAAMRDAAKTRRQDAR